MQDKIEPQMLWEYKYFYVQHIVPRLWSEALVGLKLPK